LTEAKDIMLQRGSTPRVYRNMLVFIAAEQRQLDRVKEAQRATLAWNEIVRDTKRLNLTQSDSALAEDKLKQANETLKTRMKEAWCYILHPVQDSPQRDVEWSWSRVPAQDGLLARASKKLVSEQGIWPELGPDNLNRQLEKYIWNGKPHLSLKDLWEYLNRYIYLPRVKDRSVLSKTVQAAISGMISGPFAYAERYDEKTGEYVSLTVSGGSHAHVVIDDESLIVKRDVAEEFQQKVSAGTATAAATAEPDPTVDEVSPHTQGAGNSGTAQPAAEALPTRFQGTVMISAERPARDIHQIVEAIIEQLTTIPTAEVSIKLEIDAEVPSGLDRGKVRTLIENATTLGFIDKSVK